MLLRPTLKIGDLPTMACDLNALYQFELLRGANPVRDDPDTQLALVWSMMLSDSPGLELREVGRLGSEYVLAAGDLITASFPPPKQEVAAGAEQKRSGWHELWSFGRIVLSFSETELWRLTPWMFESLSECVHDVAEREYYAAGMICATIKNQNIDHEKEGPYDPLVFLPTAKGEKAREQRKIEMGMFLSDKLRDARDVIPSRQIPQK